MSDNDTVYILTYDYGDSVEVYFDLKSFVIGMAKDAGFIPIPNNTYGYSQSKDGKTQDITFELLQENGFIIKNNVNREEIEKLVIDAIKSDEKWLEDHFANGGATITGSFSTMGQKDAMIEQEIQRKQYSWKI